MKKQMSKIILLSILVVCSAIIFFTAPEKQAMAAHILPIGENGLSRQAADRLLIAERAGFNLQGLLALEESEVVYLGSKLIFFESRNGHQAMHTLDLSQDVVREQILQLPIYSQTPSPIFNLQDGRLSFIVKGEGTLTPTADIIAYSGAQVRRIKSFERIRSVDDYSDRYTIELGDSNYAIAMKYYPDNGENFTALNMLPQQASEMFGAYAEVISAKLSPTSSLENGEMIITTVRADITSSTKDGLIFEEHVVGIDKTGSDYKISKQVKTSRIIEGAERVQFLLQTKIYKPMKVQKIDFESDGAVNDDGLLD